MIARYALIALFILLLITGIGVWFWSLQSAARPATPTPTISMANVFPLTITPGPMLPRFTPHVTLPPPTSTPTPQRTATPLPTQTPIVVLPTPTPTMPPNSGVYILQPGDTLYDIAQKYHVSLQQLAALNHITDPTTIKTGQQLLIP